MWEKELETRRVWCRERAVVFFVFCLKSQPTALSVTGTQWPSGSRKGLGARRVSQESSAPPAQPAECPSALRTGKSQRTEDSPAPTTMG